MSTPGAMGPEAQAKLADRGWRLRTSAWLLSPILTCGLGTGISFVYIGVRAKRKDWWISGITYLVAIAIFFSVSGQDQDSALYTVGAVLLFGTYFGGVAHGLFANRAWLRFRAVESVRGPWWTNGAVQQPAPQGWTGHTPTTVPAQLSGMGVDPAQFYGSGQPPAPVAPAPQPRGQVTREAPLVPPPTRKASRETAEQGALDVNAASEAELAQIPGMSAARTHAVLTARRTGRIESIEKFAEVTKMPPHDLAKVRHLLTFKPAEPGRANRPGGRVLDF